MAQAGHAFTAVRLLITGPDAKPSTSPIRAAYLELLAGLAGPPPRSFPLNPHIVDLEERLDHLSEVLTARSYHPNTTCYDTAKNVSGGLGLRIGTFPSDSASDVNDAVQKAVKEMARRVA
jgi:hypothetical protein